MQEIRLEEYQIPAYLIDSTHLHFELGESGTLVKSNLQMRLNPDYPQHKGVALVLDGVELDLKRITIDGHALLATDYSIDEETLTVHKVPKCFELECVTHIKPHQNTYWKGYTNPVICSALSVRHRAFVKSPIIWTAPM